MEELPPDIFAYYEPLRIHEPIASDASLFPSYSRLELPYRVICRLRYERIGRVYRRQFLKEIRTQELLMPRAIDGVRVHRAFQNHVFKPIGKEVRIRLTESENIKLDKILHDTGR